MRLIDADELEKKKYSYFSHETAKYRQVVFMGDVDRMPTIDAVPVIHARWIGHLEDDSIAPPGSCACSNCHHFTRSPLIYVWKYCPNCGARLDGDEDG